MKTKINKTIKLKNKKGFCDRAEPRPVSDGSRKAEKAGKNKIGKYTKSLQQQSKTYGAVHPRAGLYRGRYTSDPKFSKSMLWQSDSNSTEAIYCWKFSTESRFLSILLFSEFVFYNVFGINFETKLRLNVSPSVH